ncbi:MAG: hypothetical protein NC331_00605 [Lachnospiraceae bacterium]|nr:hypothetical protein [Lachnospiraceae bacterium]MCM1237868.1 hypothetical protein [Lachnospiraceae bacterium]
MKNTIFIGSVISSKIALETMIDQGIKIDLVCSLDEEASANVSDYFPLHLIAEKNRLPYLKFKKINADEVVDRMRKVDPDFIFVIGLSQILSSEILNLAKEYVIGFHPTPLPKYRGRAALPWMILLGEKELKVSFFKLDEGMDSGDIICQYPYMIEDVDYVTDVYDKVCQAIHLGLIQCLPDIYNDSVNFIPQNEEQATYLLIRRPEDGKIDWMRSAYDIAKLVRAASHPYPGAFTSYNEIKFIIWRAYPMENKQYIGLPGQIAWINENNEIGVITAEGILVISDYEYDGKRLIIGHKFL